MRILVSGFEPFGPFKTNPTEILAGRASSWSNAVGAEIRGVLLPVNWSQSWPRLRTAIREFQPNLVLALGLAGDRRSIDLERIGVNLADSETPDNEGVIEREAELVPRGPAALFATLPFGPMRAAMQAEAGDAAPVRLSLSAGSYLCNAVLYQTLFDLRFSVVRAGFLHLPPTPQMGLGFGLDVELLERVVGAGLREVVAPSGVRPN